MIQERNVTNVISVKPKAVFLAAEQAFPRENIEVTSTLPPSGIGSLLALENAVIVAVMKLVSPKAIFEFGTFNGSSAVLFARNTPGETMVTTLDLPEEEISTLDKSGLDIKDGRDNDEFLRREFLNSGAFYIKRSDCSIREKIIQIRENSLKFEPASYKLCSTQDLIFIDGGHDYLTVENDTDKAKILGKRDRVMIWHDYGSETHPDVSLYLRRCTLEGITIHILHTMLAMNFGGAHEQIGQKILNSLG